MSGPTTNAQWASIILEACGINEEWQEVEARFIEGKYISSHAAERKAVEQIVADIRIWQQQNVHDRMRASKAVSTVNQFLFQASMGDTDGTSNMLAGLARRPDHLSDVGCEMTDREIAAARRAVLNPVFESREVRRDSRKRDAAESGFNCGIEWWLAHERDISFYVGSDPREREQQCRRIEDRMFKYAESQMRKGFIGTILWWWVVGGVVRAVIGALVMWLVNRWLLNREANR